MTKFILYIATTLDGYVARLDGSIDWLTSFDIPEAEDGYAAFYDTVDALVMGATTYEQVLGFGDWPYPGKCSYVLTSRPIPVEREDIRLMNTIESLLADINHNEFERVWVVGGGKVASAFMSQGLIDEYVLTLMPIILGAGISLYQAVPEQRLKLVEAKPFSYGAVELRYQNG